MLFFQLNHKVHYLQTKFIHILKHLKPNAAKQIRSNHSAIGVELGAQSAAAAKKKTLNRSRLKSKLIACFYSIILFLFLTWFIGFYNFSIKNLHTTIKWIVFCRFISFCVTGTYTTNAQKE